MLNLKVASFDEKIFHGSVERVTVKTIEGEITFMTNSIPYISLIKNGRVSFEFEGEKITHDIKSGNVTKLANNDVIVLVNDL